MNIQEKRELHIEYPLAIGGFSFCDIITVIDRIRCPPPSAVFLIVDNFIEKALAILSNIAYTKVIPVSDRTTVKAPVL